MRFRSFSRATALARAFAKRIIALAQRGERDPIRLREGAVRGVWRRAWWQHLLFSARLGVLRARPSPAVRVWLTLQASTAAN